MDKERGEQIARLARCLGPEVDTFLADPRLDRLMAGLVRRGVEEVVTIPERVEALEDVVEELGEALTLLLAEVQRAAAPVSAAQQGAVAALASWESFNRVDLYRAGRLAEQATES